MWVFALFLAVPLIEIALFVTVGGWLGLWPTLAIVVGTGFLGVFIMRQLGLRAMADMQTALRGLQSPVSLMAHNALIMTAGLLLVLPGFLTDTLGLLLLIAPLRQVLITRFAGGIGALRRRKAAPDWRDGPGLRADAEVIDAEYSELDPEHPARRGTSRWTQD